MNNGQPRTHSLYEFIQESPLVLRKQQQQSPSYKPLGSMIGILGLKADQLLTDNPEPSILCAYPPESASIWTPLLQFCFSDGFYLDPYEDNQDELCKFSFNHMICTDEFGNRMYLTYILFKELFFTPSSGQMFVVPKSISFVSNFPIFEV